MTADRKQSNKSSNNRGTGSSGRTRNTTHSNSNRSNRSSRNRNNNCVKICTSFISGFLLCLLLATIQFNNNNNDILPFSFFYGSGSSSNTIVSNNNNNTSSSNNNNGMIMVKEQAMEPIPPSSTTTNTQLRSESKQQQHQQQQHQQHEGIDEIEKLQTKEVVSPSPIKEKESSTTTTTSTTGGFSSSSSSSASSASSASSSSINQRNNNVIIMIPDPIRNYAWRPLAQQTYQGIPSYSWFETYGSLQKHKTQTTTTTTTSFLDIVNTTKLVILAPDAPQHIQWDLNSILTSTIATTTTTTNATTTSTNIDPPPPRSVVFYGSHHLKELYRAMIRLKRGVAYNTPVGEETEDEHEEVEEEKGTIDGSNLTISSSSSTTNKTTTTEYMDPRIRVICDNEHGSKVGIDFEICGIPEMKVITEFQNTSNNNTVLFGLKTYLHTPDADTLFVQFLKQHQEQLFPPWVLIVDIGIWGPRGSTINPHSTTTNTPMTDWTLELDYFFDWIQTTFPTTHIIYIYEPTNNNINHHYLEGFDSNILHRLEQLHTGEYETYHPRKNNVMMTMNEELEEVEGNDDDDDDDTADHNTNTQKKTVIPSSLILRKDLLLKNKPKDMECNGSACTGPLMEVMARLIMAWLQDLTLNK